METAFAQELCNLNNRFYRTWANSFSETRHNIWPGWIRCLKETNLVPNAFSNSKDDVAPESRSNNPVDEIRLPSNTYPHRDSKSFTEPHKAPGERTNSSNAKQETTLQMLDVACGNLRFEEFLARSLPNRRINAFTLDSCDEMVQTSTSAKNLDIEFRHCDVMQALQEGNLDRFFASTKRQKAKSNTVFSKGNTMHSGGTLKPTECKKSDLAVSFGFMHHIPLPEWRIDFIKALIRATKTGGHICVSFWRFLNSPSLAAKANETHAKAMEELALPKGQFNEGDYLLGWKNQPGVYRYCHSFTNEEIDELILEMGELATLKARFQADGRTGNLNEYLVLQKHFR